uniref:Uncharacterized protein n=1 Tax=Clytia hemisphaerica TaxID=252671 RepID=A0A7M6DQU8_9CNID|eukprot:TCONS_00025402-protein
MIKRLQQERDTADDNHWSKCWWGHLLKDYKRRVDSLKDCKIQIIHSSGNYATLQFRGGSGENTVYGKQSFYLRNQWNAETGPQFDNTKSYWFSDIGSSGWMNGVINSDGFQNLVANEEIRERATKEQREYEAGDEIEIREFTEEERKFAAELCLPFVRKIDEVISQEGKSAQDYGFCITEWEMIEGQTGLDGYSLYTSDVTFINNDDGLKAKMFQSLQILSADVHSSE